MQNSQTNRLSRNAKTFFDTPDSYLENNYTIQLRVNFISEIFNGSNHSTLLDLGCGDGSLSLPFVDQFSKVVLVDYSKNMLLKAKSKTSSPNVLFIESDVIELDLHEKYDIVLCIGVFAHVDSIEKMMQVILKHLIPSTESVGLIQFTDSNHFWYSVKKKLTNSPYKPNEITKEEVDRLLVKYNLKLKKTYTYFDGSLGLRSISKTLGNFIQQLLSRIPLICSEYIYVIQQK